MHIESVTLSVDALSFEGDLGYRVHELCASLFQDTTALDQPIKITSYIKNPHVLSNKVEIVLEFEYRGAPVEVEADEVTDEADEVTDEADEVTDVHPRSPSWLEPCPVCGVKAKYWDLARGKFYCSNCRCLW